MHQTYWNIVAMSSNNCCAYVLPRSPSQPLLREFLKSEAYEPYLVLSSSTGSPDLQRELETVSTDEQEHRGAATVTKFGVCGTINFERVTSEASGGKGKLRFDTNFGMLYIVFSLSYNIVLVLVSGMLSYTYRGIVWNTSIPCTTFWRTMTLVGILA